MAVNSIRTCFIALALAFAASADAGTYEIPSPLSSTVQTLHVSVQDKGAFCDLINFSLDGTGLSTFNLAAEIGKLNKSGFAVNIFDSANRLLFGSSSSVMGTLDAGSYYATVAGFFKTKDNQYAFSAFTAPVPLPAALWMLGGGLAGFWFVGRRKNTTTNA